MLDQYFIADLVDLIYQALTGEAGISSNSNAYLDCLLLSSNGNLVKIDYNQDEMYTTKTVACNVVAADIGDSMVFATNEVVTYKSSSEAVPKKEYVDNVSKCLVGYHSAILILIDGTIKVIGSNSSGQLGTRSTLMIDEWKTVPQITDIITGSCRGTTSILVRSDGQIYMAGDDTHEMVGVNVNGFKLHPTVKDIIAVYSTSNAIFLLTISGNVLYSGNLHLDARPNDTFKQLPITGVIDMALGRTLALFLTSNGKLFGYGHDPHGKFGSLRRYNTLNVIEVPTGDLRVRKITCSINLSIIMDTKGDVYIIADTFHKEFRTFTKVKGVNLLR